MSEAKHEINSVDYSGSVLNWNIEIESPLDPTTSSLYKYHVINKNNNTDRYVVNSQVVNGTTFAASCGQSRWNMLNSRIKYNDDDIFVISYPKCGTTWIEQVVLLLLNNGNINDVNPVHKNVYIPNSNSKSGKIWCESSIEQDPGVKDKMGLEAYPITWEEFESAPRPRVLKTHSPYHLLLGTNGNGVKALPLTTKVILMSRNPLDACVSSYYHAWNPFKSGWPFEAWASLWLNGYVPHGSWFDWVKGWYKESIDNSNQILWLQYEDLKINPIFQIEKIAKFLNINYNENLLELVAKASSFESMKEQAEALSDKIPVGHLRKGKSGDWKNHFSSSLYNEFKSKYDSEMTGIGLSYSIGDDDEPWIS